MNTDILMSVHKELLGKDDQYKADFLFNIYTFAEKELGKLQEKNNVQFLQRQNDVIPKEDIPQEPSEEPTKMEDNDRIEETGECPEPDQNG